MKHAARFFLLVGSALLLTILTPARKSINTHVKAPSAKNAAISMYADGGYPIPPFPGGSSLTAGAPVLSADGGYPIPPFPGGSFLVKPVLSADGGYPIPPFPGGSLLTASLG